MELVDGQTLRATIDADTPMEWDRVASLLSQLADALRVAHLAALVHRDIKPSNILVQRGPDGAERCRLIDFGLVRGLAPDASTELTITGQLVGTPSYISPEALRGGTLDGRSDQYSLGIVAYELLEGTRPFEGTGLEGLFLQHLLTPPRPRRRCVGSRRLSEVRSGRCCSACWPPSPRSSDSHPWRLCSKRCARFAPEAVPFDCTEILRAAGHVCCSPSQARRRSSVAEGGRERSNSPPHRASPSHHRRGRSRYPT